MDGRVAVVTVVALLDPASRRGAGALDGRIVAVSVAVQVRIPCPGIAGAIAFVALLVGRVALGAGLVRRVIAGARVAEAGLVQRPVSIIVLAVAHLTGGEACLVEPGGQVPPAPIEATEDPDDVLVLVGLAVLAVLRLGRICVYALGVGDGLVQRLLVAIAIDIAHDGAA